jgi:hypothetical protein
MKSLTRLFFLCSLLCLACCPLAQLAAIHVNPAI